MGLLSRASYIVRAKLSGLLNRAENPEEQLDYSYEKLRDQLQEVKEGISDLTTQKKRLEIQRDNLKDDIEKHNEQARAAMEKDKEDLARRALEKKKAKMQQVEELNAQISNLKKKQDQLIDQKDELKQRIEEFQTKKETMKAQHKAAKASKNVSEAMTGAGEEFDDVGRAIQKAEEQTEEMEARAQAMEELEETGALENTLSDKDDLERELEDVKTSNEVDAELETLREEVGDTSEAGNQDEHVDAQAE